MIPSREELSSALSSALEMIPDPDDEAIRSAIEGLLRAGAGPLSIRDKQRLSAELFASVRRLDVLQSLIDDPGITEIMVNGPEHIFAERDGKLFRTRLRFSSREKLEDVVRQIAGRCNRVINERMPIVDARLPDGSRVNAVIAPAALDGPILTIRRFPEDPITMPDLIARGSISREAAEALSVLVRAKYSILIGGGTSAGKTTFLNALSDAIPKEERIITIEDNAELQIRGVPNLVRLEAKRANTEDGAEVTIRDLIKSALRMRPDRIIVGEVRGGEAIDMLQALNTGHDGSLSTLHANTAADLISRLSTMVLMAFPLPLPAIHSQIASGVDLIVHLGRLPDHSRRILEIAEIDVDGQGTICLHPLFIWDQEKKTLVRTGRLRHTLKLERTGLAHEEKLHGL